jgi:hypothetical protein
LCMHLLTNTFDMQVIISSIVLVNKSVSIKKYHVSFAR